MNEKYLEFVRSFPCAFCNRSDGIDAHHIAHRAWREVKRDDYVTLPLCRECHSLWHSVGFEKAIEKHHLKLVKVFETAVTMIVAFFLAYEPPEWNPPDAV